jgi:hypothetical protein
MKALREREEPNRTGKLSTIVFLRDRNGKNQGSLFASWCVESIEISGYIDLMQRLQNESLSMYGIGTAPVAGKRRKMMPRQSDLSFYNWETQVCVTNDTPNYQVINDHPQGLLFKNKRDRKVVGVDPKESAGDCTSRTTIISPEYSQIVIYDHIMCRKS